MAVGNNMGLLMQTHVVLYVSFLLRLGFVWGRKEFILGNGGSVTKNRLVMMLTASLYCPELDSNGCQLGIYGDIRGT